MIKHILLFIAILCGFFLFYFSFFPVDHSDLVGTKAPLFEAHSLEHQTFDLKNHIGQNVILINIWATWCEPCREEIPILNKIQDSLDKNKFMIVSLMQDDAANDELKLKALNRFREKIPINFPVYFDNEGLIADKFGTYQIPESYLIDLSGKIVYKHTGPVTKWDEKSLIEKIQKLIP